MFSKIKHYLILAGSITTLLLSYIIGRKLEGNKHLNRKVKEQAEDLEAHNEYQKKAKDIDEETSKKNAHITTSNVVSELNSLFTDSKS